MQTRAELERWRAAVEHDGDQQHVVKIIDSHLELYDRLEASIDETIAETKARSELAQVVFEQIKINNLLSRDIIDTAHGIAHVVHDLRCEAAARIAEVGGDTRDLRARNALDTADDLIAALPDQPGAP